MNRSLVLDVKNLVKRFPIKSSSISHERFITVVNDISFKLFEGEALGVLGPNGAGKTTLIKMLLSLLTPTSGAITYFGKNFFTHRSEILERVSFASSYIKLPARLTVRTNLDIYAQLYGISSQERAHRIEKYLKFFGIWNLADKETGILSSGQMTRVMLAKAFMSQPKVVLLDEPTASLDPESALEARAFIKEQQKEHGIGLLLTSHSMEEVTQICDRVLVIKQGNIIANDTPHNLAFSVARTRVILMTENPTKMVDYAQSQGLSYKRADSTIIIEIDEQAIPRLLEGLTSQGITYTSIAIHSPDLNDYFLSIAKESR
jgi:ABC-2 type transport system ATP-binding protein